jgi:hypothetical protein
MNPKNIQSSYRFFREAKKDAEALRENNYKCRVVSYTPKDSPDKEWYIKFKSKAKP